HHAGGAQHPRQRARVDVRDGDNVVTRQVVAQRAFGAPVAGDRGLLAHDEAGDLRAARLGVVVRDAVVAHLGRRHRDDLAGVRRIGEDLLVAGHARVEHDFAAGLAGGPRGFPFVPDPVFERQSCFHLYYLSSSEPVTRAIAPAVTRVVALHGCFPAISIFTTCEPIGTPGRLSGVWPTLRPSTNTVAPRGRESTSMLPV